MDASDVVVVGAGVVGCAVAYSLASAGLSVTVIERERPGRQSSATCTGVLDPISDSRMDATLRAAGLASLDLLREIVPELAELSEIDPRFDECGVLRVALGTERDALRTQALDLSAYDCVWLEPDELKQIERRLGPEASGALWSPRDAQVDARLLGAAFAAAAHQLGVAFVLDTEVIGLGVADGCVSGVVTPDGVAAAGDVVLCGGAWSGQAGIWIDRPIPIEPVRGQILALAALEPALPSVIDCAGVSIVPSLGGEVWVGSTVERVGFDLEPTDEGARWLRTRAARAIPELDALPLLRAWSGLRPDTPDHLPMIGAVPGTEGLLLATGHYSKGVLLSAITGVGIAELMIRGRPLPALAPFDPARFSS